MSVRSSRAAASGSLPAAARAITRQPGGGLHVAGGGVDHVQDVAGPVLLTETGGALDRDVDRRCLWVGQRDARAAIEHDRPARPGRTSLGHPAQLRPHRLARATGAVCPGPGNLESCQRRAVRNWPGHGRGAHWHEAGCSARRDRKRRQCPPFHAGPRRAGCVLHRSAPKLPLMSLRAWLSPPSEAAAGRCCGQSCRRLDCCATTSQKAHMGSEQGCCTGFKISRRKTGGRGRWAGNSKVNRARRKKAKS